VSQVASCALVVLHVAAAAAAFFTEAGGVTVGPTATERQRRYGPENVKAWRLIWLLRRVLIAGVLLFHVPSGPPCR
jgi:hypothetical protein